MPDFFYDDEFDGDESFRDERGSTFERETVAGYIESRSLSLGDESYN